MLCHGNWDKHRKSNLLGSDFTRSPVTRRRFPCIGDMTFRHTVLSVLNECKNWDACLQIMFTLDMYLTGWGSLMIFFGKQCHFNTANFTLQNCSQVVWTRNHEFELLKPQNLWELRMRDTRIISENKRIIKIWKTGQYSIKWSDLLDIHTKPTPLYSPPPVKSNDPNFTSLV